MIGSITGMLAAPFRDTRQRVPALQQGQSAAGDAPTGWLEAVLLVVFGTFAISLLFIEEMAAAVRVWNSSTTYNHCWLILPTAAWLGWTRRRRLARLTPEATPWAVLLIASLGLLWFAAERLGMMEGRQLAALATAEAFLLCVLGTRVVRAMAATLLFLVFLVPFGAFATPLLQQVTAWNIAFGLQLVGVPHIVDDLVITTPAGNFLVAEACAGLRFLVAAVAFGALYSATMFRSAQRRMIVLALSFLVPVVANGLRAFSIVLLGQFLGSSDAAAADHTLYGWFFFALVIVLMILAGLPFREDRDDGAPSSLHCVADRGGQRRADGRIAAMLAVAVAAAGPAVAAALKSVDTTAPAHIPLRLVPPPECEPDSNGEGIRCGGTKVFAQISLFSPRVTWAMISAERSRFAGHDDQAEVFDVLVSGSVRWQVRQSARTVAIAAWSAGQPAGGLRSRLHQAWNSLGLGHGVPVLAVVTLEPGEGARAADRARQRALLEEVLRAQGSDAGGAAALSAGR